MLALISATLATGFVDSLNPSAVAQQMLLQTLVEKKHHVLFFITGLAFANFIMGVAVYYGIAAQALSMWEQYIAVYPLTLRIAESVLGVACLITGSLMFFRLKHRAFQSTASQNSKPVSRLAPNALFVMGMIFCMVELTSALPYFGFLAILSGYQFTVFPVLAFIFLYTFIYSAPLILLYLGYSRVQNHMIIIRIESIVGRISPYILPVAAFVLGAYLSFNGIYNIVHF